MFNFCTWIYDCDSHSSAFITVTSHSLSSNPCICSTVVFSSLGNSYHFLDLVLIGFFFKLKRDAPFHRTIYSSSRSDRGGCRDHLRDVPWEGIFELVLLLLALNFISGSRLEVMCISLFNIWSSLIYLHGFQPLVLLQ